jgi:hydantoinase/carbamoylase family amidase
MPRAAAVEPASVVAALRELATLTGDTHGAQRLAWSHTWLAARAWLIERLSDLALEVDVDEAGNLWFTLVGRRPDALIVGSHLDSIPDGGWLDGCLGVLAGAEVLASLAARGTPPMTVKLVDWADEEGVRFGGQSMFGSATAAGAIDPAALADAVDAQGVRFVDAARSAGVDLTVASSAQARLADARCYLELHIEQGPELEGLDRALAAVTGTVGIERHAFRFQGTAAHAGSTPMRSRHDALAGAARLALQARAVAVAADGRATVGQMTVAPGLATVIADEVEMSVDLRHHSAGALAGMLSETQAAAERIGAQEGVATASRATCQIAPVEFDRGLVALVAEAIAELTHESAHTMVSGALHDAAQLQSAGVATAMIFVRSIGGISHAVSEDSRVEDLELGVRALAAVAERALAG